MQRILLVAVVGIMLVCATLCILSPNIDSGWPITRHHIIFPANLSPPYLPTTNYKASLFVKSY